MRARGVAAVGWPAGPTLRSNMINGGRLLQRAKRALSPIVPKRSDLLAESPHADRGVVPVGGAACSTNRSDLTQIEIDHREI